MSLLSCLRQCKRVNSCKARVRPHDGYPYLARLIPVAIIGANRFFTVLDNLLSKFLSYIPHVFIVSFIRGFSPTSKLGVIGYWSAIFAAIVLAEHFVFRKNNFNSYRIQDWDKPSKLPAGIAALLSFLGGFVIVIPSMSQEWYTGAIAKAGAGNIGIITGSVVSAALYLILRALEKKILEY